MGKDKEEIEKEIISFLDKNSTKRGDGTLPGCGLKHGIACALGTCKDNIPRVTPVDFFNDGLTLWIIGDPGGKLRNIRSNPKVAVAIYTPMDHSKENRSLQLWGKAQLVTKRHQKELFTETITKFGILEAIRKAMRGNMIKSTYDESFETALDRQLNKVTLIKIEPEKIAYLIIRPDERQKRLIWEKDEDD